MLKSAIKTGGHIMVVAAAALAVTAVTAVSPADAATTTTGFAGYAYGSYVSGANGAVTSGYSSLVTVGCTRDTGLHNSGTVASVNAGAALQTGTVTTTVDTLAGPPQASRSTSTVQTVNALNGVIRATAVKSVSTTTHDLTGYHVSSAGTTFTGLVINGVPIAPTVAPNTRINLPGFGFVVLNQQGSSVGLNSALLSVAGIHVVITTTNSLNIAVGTNIAVAVAYSGQTGSVSGSLSGVAYGTQVKVGSLVKSTGSFPQPLACYGTNGAVISNTGAAVTIPSVLSTGTVADTAQGTDNLVSVVGRTTSTVQSLNLLSNLVSATVIKADSQATKSGTGATLVDRSSFGTLIVKGHPEINAAVPANTSVAIPGLGTLYLHRVIRTANGIEVRMIELVVLQSNSYGLAIGTDVQVAVARVSAF